MNNKGFSLVELLAIITILGLIMAIAIPAYQHYVTKSRTTGYTTLINTSKSAAQNRYIDEELPPGCQKYSIEDDLYKQGYMDKPSDPAATANNCTGFVYIKEDTSSNTMENYKTLVSLKCSTYSKDECIDSGGAPCTFSASEKSECGYVAPSGGGTPDDPTPDDPDDPDDPPSPPPTPDPPTPTPDGKPTCTITPNISPNANNWFKTNVTLTLNISSNTTNYGLAVSKNSTNKTKSVVVSNEGTTTYYGYVSNSGGSNECSYTVNLDKTPPTVTISTKNDKYSVTAKMTDNVSGLASYKWKGGDLTTISGKSVEKTKNIGTSNGKSSIKVTDKAGNSNTKEFSAYEWCDKKYSPDSFAIYRWGDITLSCSGSTYYRKYRFHEYECICSLDAKDHDHVCKQTTKEGNHGSDYAYIYYKHTDNGQKSCKGTLKINAHVTHVCNSNEYAATNKPTFDYHGYRFFDGAAQDGWTNFEGKGYTYWRKAGLISNSNTPDEACGIACTKRN